MTNPLDSALATYIEGLCSRWAITAVSANTISGTAQAFGTPPGAEAPMTTDTVVSICSNTKLFVAVSLGMLVEEGKLAWTDRLVDLIPGFAVKNKRSERLVTVEAMLSHMTGIEKTNYVFSRDTMHADIVAAIATMECNAEYKQKFIYSNAMFSLAGHLIALLSGLKMADFVRSRILEPLGMTNSDFDMALLNCKGTTPCVSLDDNKTAYPINTNLRGLSSDSAWMAAGALLSTTNDLVKWIGYLHRTVSGTNRLTDPKIVSRETLKEIIKPRTTGPMAMHFFGDQGLALFPEFSTPLYALACQRFHLYGIDVVCHTGDMPGNGSLTVWTPDRDFGIVLLTNDERRGGTVMTLAALRAFELHFGIEPIDWEKRALTMPPMYATGPSPLAQVKERKAPSISLDELVGTYCSGYGEFHIFASKPGSIEDLPSKAKFVLEELARAEFGGRARPNPLLIGCFDKDMISEHYIAIFELSGDSYWLESHQMFWSADRKLVQDFPISVLWIHDASSLGGFSRMADGGIAFEFRKGWCEPWDVRKPGETLNYFKRIGPFPSDRNA